MAPPTRMYRIREFAARAGVTIRALRHYDRLGLLSPKRTHAGYRVYTDADLPALEQIVALRFIGLPLKSIKTLLQRGGGDLARALGAQRTLLEERRRGLAAAIAAIREAETALQAAGGVEREVFKRIIELIEMQNHDTDWQRKYDSLVTGKIARLKEMSPERREELRAQWLQLVGDIEGALGEDPASTHAQALPGRWVELLSSFSDVPLGPQVIGSFGAAYQGAGEWTPKLAGFGDERIWHFMGRALAVWARANQPGA